MFFFGVAHPDDPFPIAEPFSKGKQTPIWREKKENFNLYGQETSFFKSNMDALTVLSICDTEIEEKIRKKCFKTFLGNPLFLPTVQDKMKFIFCGLVKTEKGEKEYYLAWHACFMVVPNKHRATIVKCEQ